ncbi:MAG: hypothetical protein ACO3EE_03285 [Flavobacteriales bacterium]
MKPQDIAAAVAENAELSIKKRSELRMKQMLLLISAVLYPAFGYINLYVVSPSIENESLFIQRIVFAALICIALLVSIFSTFVKKIFYIVIISFAYIAIGHLLYIGSVIGFKSAHFVGVIMVLFGTSLVFKRKIDLNYYLLFNIFSCAIATIYAPPSDLQNSIVIAVYVTICVVIYISLNAKINAERELRKNEANLNALIENTSDLIWSIDSNYRLLTANKAYLEMRKTYLGKYPKLGDEITLNEFPEKIKHQWKSNYTRALNGEFFTAEASYFYQDKHTMLNTHSILLKTLAIKQKVQVFSQEMLQKTSISNKEFKNYWKKLKKTQSSC